MSRRRVILIVLAAAALSALAIGGYYWYRGSRFIITDDARVAANLVSVSPEIAGRLLEWRALEGDRVSAGEVLGRQDLGAALSSGALSPQSLGSVAGVVAEKAVLKAPISGQVILTTAVVGEMATPGLSLAVIADTGSLYINANIKEGDIADVRVGQDVDVRIDAFHRRRFHGKVASIGRATASTFSLLPATTGGGNYTKVVQVVPIKIGLVDRGDAGLMIGMNATVRIHRNEKAGG
jgi:multidrug resistance efflux pump